MKIYNVMCVVLIRQQNDSREKDSQWLDSVANTAKMWTNLLLLSTLRRLVSSPFERHSNLELCNFVTIQMKATEQYFPVVLFIMLYKMVLTFESVDEILQCGHSYDSY